MNFEVIVPDEFEDEFKKFVVKLDKVSRARLTKEINTLEKHGTNLGMPYSKRINNQLYELRTSGQQKVRILYHVNGRKIYLLNWFVKKSQKLPIQELEKAISRLSYTYHS
jgi:phage-related protein